MVISYHAWIGGKFLAQDHHMKGESAEYLLANLVEATIVKKGLCVRPADFALHYKDNVPAPGELVMTDPKLDEEAIFNMARKIDSPEARQSYLQHVCSGDAAILSRVEALLRVHEQDASFLAFPAAGPVATIDEPLSERPGTVIGPYKLLSQIGAGGFGIVFMAEQHQPIRRRVALKVLKPGMDTRQVVARFEAERQALALMDHPNIAKIFDAGTTGEKDEGGRMKDEKEADGRSDSSFRLHRSSFGGGRPYFVMELVRGIPITEFCDQNHLPVRQRLELFVNVCKAVQHAHQKGIIHRDLKPTNIMVTLHDGVPVPKVIDFGIAKAMGQQLTDKSLFTNFAQMIGTPMYMSPEQAQMSGLDVDTRTDIYSLGVLLYELMTGATPLDSERLRTAGYDEIRRLIREEDPARPSTRMSTLDEAVTMASANRKSDPKRLSQLFRGELDWIVLKALEKDRNRRYETASALAADVQRYLKNEPVQACPPSRWYRFRKLVVRNKQMFVAASAAVLMVLLALVTLTVSNVLIRQEQARTEDEKDRADGAHRLAEARAEQIQRDLERLKTANVLLERGRWYGNNSRWDDAHAALTKAVELRPDHAAVWFELSELHTRLGLWELAAADFARELELREPDSTFRWYQHAHLRLYLGDVEGYRQVVRRMRGRFRGTENAYFIGELVRASSLVADSDAEVKQLVRLVEQLSPDHFREWFFNYVAGIAHYRAGQHEQAVQPS